MVDRVTTAGTYRTAIADIGQAQVKLAELQQQISSGRKASTFTELGSDIVGVLDLESSIKASDRFISGNKIVLTRLQVQDQAVSQLERIASDLRSQLVLERSNGSVLNLAAFARSALAQVADSLNTQQGGRYLFSGSRTDQPATTEETLINNSNIIEGNPTSSYYQGDALKFSIRASAQLNLEYGVTGNEPAFQQLIGALHEAIASEDPANNSTQKLDHAFELVNEAVDYLTVVRSRINDDIVTLGKVNDQHALTRTQLQQVLSDVTGTDVVDASIQVSLGQAVLTATLQSFARITSLSLTDYLR